MNTDYKTGKLLQIIKEWEARGLSEFEISGTEISRAVFFYREANKKFVPIPKGSYTVTMLDSSKADKLLITNIDIQTKAVEYQICYEDEQISSLYIEDFPELDVLVKKYNDVVNDIRNIIQLLKTIGMKSDTSQMTQVLTKLQVNTFWYLNENGELDTFPIGDLNSKYQDMLENMKTNVEQTLNSVYQALKLDLENLIRNYNTVVDQAKQHIDNTKTSAETNIDNKKVQSIDALNTLKQDLENQLNTIKNGLSNDLSSELQTHLQNLASSVNRYITDNRDILKGDKGDGITNIQQLKNNKLRLFYGDNNSVDVNLPAVSEEKVIEITGELYAPKFEKSNIYWGSSEEKIATEKAVGLIGSITTRRDLAILGSNKNQWGLDEIEKTSNRVAGNLYRHGASNKIYYCKTNHNINDNIEIHNSNVWEERTIEHLYNNLKLMQTELNSLKEKSNQINSYCPYKVGDIYITTSNSNPATLWLKTTWQKIEGRFLRATSNSETSGLIAGSDTKTLAVDNLPTHKHTITINSSGVHTHTQASHSHTQPQHKHSTTWDIGNKFDTTKPQIKSLFVFQYEKTTPENFYSNFGGGENTGAAQPAISSAGNHNHTATIGNTGNGVPFDIKPAYITVHIWKRIS